MNFHKTGADLRFNAEQREKKLLNALVPISLFTSFASAAAAVVIAIFYDFSLFHLPLIQNAHTISRNARRNRAHSSGDVINLSTFYATIPKHR